MSQPVESYVATPPNQTMPGANNIRQFQEVIPEPQPAATMTTVLVEAVASVDATLGRPLDLESLDWQAEVLFCLRSCVQSVKALCAAHDIELDLDDNLPSSTDG